MSCRYVAFHIARLRPFLHCKRMKFLPKYRVLNGFSIVSLSLDIITFLHLSVLDFSTNFCVYEFSFSFAMFFSLFFAATIVKTDAKIVSLAANLRQIIRDSDCLFQTMF